MNPFAVLLIGLGIGGLMGWISGYRTRDREQRVADARAERYRRPVEVISDWRTRW